MENMDIYSDSNDVEGINSTESLFLTQNRYGLLTITIGASSNKGFLTCENINNGTLNSSSTGFTTVHRKRATVNTGGKSSQNVSDADYDDLSTDDKLSVMFAQMKSIGQKVDDCLLLHNRVHTIENTLSGFDHRLKLLEYKSIDLEARSRRNNLIFSGISELKDENCADRISEFLSYYLHINSCPPIPRAHRLGRYRRGSVRSIIVYFLDYRDTVYVLSQANKLKGTNFSINRDFPKEIVNARRRLWSEYKRLRSANPDCKTNIVYPANLVSNGHTVADEFPDWSLIMQASRTSTCSSEQHAVQTEPNITHDRHDKHNQHNNNRDPSTRSLNTAHAALSSKPRRVQSGSPHPLRGRSHAPVSRRSPISSQSTSAQESPNFQRPWTTRPVDSCRGPPVRTCTSNYLNLELCHWICQYDSTPLGTWGDRLYYKPAQNKG